MTFNEKIFTEVLIEKTETALNHVRFLMEIRRFPSERFTDAVNVLTAHLCCLGMIEKPAKRACSDSTVSETSS
jgi:uncharacterized membrane protein